ncbi:MAG: hypothetical protein BAJALOKI1v1_250015 [Promethearchaeota archaeon]|nr:MAG: hypothetical protein BAJALOKI1v1_250015 [Candidatus Lokiarchaeota archaeon]
MIESIRLKSFRKHDDLQLNFDPKFNLLHGRNNAGKTTIFYAIEYCLFGQVNGFKKIAQLTKFKQKAVGVELIFQGKDAARYKLQRMHELKGKKRSASGYYTLKKILSENEEKYVLSSDFGNREEDLSLKLAEILGISKRFFEAGVHFAQGEISKILAGDKKLDIVFGIKTASALSDVFRQRALDFEKEIQVLSTLKAVIERAKKEKKDYHEKLAKKEELQSTLISDINRQKELLNMFQDIEDLSEEVSKILKSSTDAKKAVEESEIKLKMVKEEIEAVRTLFGSEDTLDANYEALKAAVKHIEEQITQKEKELGDMQKQLQSIETQKIKADTLKTQKLSLLNEIEEFTSTYDTQDELEKQYLKFKQQYEDLTAQLKQINDEHSDLQNFFRTIEREKGDIEGILKRRQSNKDNQKCEYCGAPIDSEKIASEVKEFQKKIKELDQKIQLTEKKEKELKQKTKELRQGEKQSYEEYLKLENIIKKISEMKTKVSTSFDQDLESQIDQLNSQLQTQQTALETSTNEIKMLREDEKNKQKELNELETSIERKQKLNAQLADIEQNKQDAEHLFSIEMENFVKLLNGINTQLKAYLDALEKENYLSESLEKLMAEIQILLQNQTLETAAQFRDHFKEVIITNTTELSSTLKHLEEQKEQVSKDLEELKQQLKTLDKEIASNEKKIQILNLKKSLAERYRAFQDMFKETQEIIRENISAALEERILQFTNVLSSEDEFEKVSVDSEDYSLSITPKGMDITDSYPAAVYEGGGYQLLLGLSYKFSLSELIGKTSFLLIDEPTEFIDTSNRAKLLSNISSIADNTQVILITHQDIDKIQAHHKIELQK